ncbi:MAG: hypothetical protein ACFFBD_27940, partial [Candidatus Hodarchaeota archaeon]
MNSKICLSLFDLQLGPQILFTQNINEEEAKNVAMKSILALSGVQEVIKDAVDGILPLPDHDIVFYAYIFPLRLKKEIRGLLFTTAALAILIPKAEASILYQNASLLQIQAKEIANQIQSDFVYEPGLSLPRALRKLLTDWSIDKQVFLEQTTATEKYVIEPLGKMTVVTASRGCPYSCC